MLFLIIHSSILCNKNKTIKNSNNCAFPSIKFTNVIKRSNNKKDINGNQMVNKNLTREKNTVFVVCNFTLYYLLDVDKFDISTVGHR
jgi:hypothetical protein